MVVEHVFGGVELSKGGGMSENGYELRFPFGGVAGGGEIGIILEITSSLFLLGESEWVFFGKRGGFNCGDLMKKGRGMD